MSFNDERLKHQGRLAEAELDARRTEISVRGLITSLRNLLDPLENIEELCAEQIADQGLRLADLLAEYGRKRAEIAAIKKALGR